MVWVGALQVPQEWGKNTGAGWGSHTVGKHRGTDVGSGGTGPHGPDIFALQALMGPHGHCPQPRDTVFYLLSPPVSGPAACELYECDP